MLFEFMKNAKSGTDSYEFLHGYHLYKSPVLKVSGEESIDAIIKNNVNRLINVDFVVSKLTNLRDTILTFDNEKVKIASCIQCVLAISKQLNFLVYNGIDLDGDIIYDGPVKLLLGCVARKDDKKPFKYTWIIPLPDGFYKNGVAEYNDEHHGCKSKIYGFIDAASYKSEIEVDQATKDLDKKYTGETKEANVSIATEPEDDAYTLSSKSVAKRTCVFSSSRLIKNCETMSQEKNKPNLRENNMETGKKYRSCEFTNVCNPSQKKYDVERYDEYGNVVYQKESSTGNEFWYADGRLFHERANGIERWYNNDGDCIRMEYPNGATTWYTPATSDTPSYKSLELDWVSDDNSGEYIYLKRFDHRGKIKSEMWFFQKIKRIVAEIVK